jgi:signal transduction histidine kinase
MPWSAAKAQKQGQEQHEWPRAVPLAAFAIAFVTIGLGVAQRAGRPLGRPILYGLVALSPFLADAVEATIRRGLSWDRSWLFPIPVLVGTGLLIAHPTKVDFAPFALCFMTGEVTARSSARQWLGAAAAVASSGLMVGVEVFGHYGGAYVWIIGIVFSWFGGFLIQNLERQTHELRDAQTGLEEKAASEERSRIAREVHDVIAHSMSVTMLHITAARMALERGNSPTALESLREAETQGRNSLKDIRQTVGLLGAQSTAGAAPMPTATDLSTLVRDFSNAGLDVTLHVNGDANGIPPAAGLNLYRIAQESLTNASKYAPGATTQVELDISETEIHLTVRNGAGNGIQPDQSGGGLGIAGMTERAHMLGGSLEAGPHAADGGWRVEVAAPRPKADAT